MSTNAQRFNALDRLRLAADAPKLLKQYSDAQNEFKGAEYRLGEALLTLRGTPIYPEVLTALGFDQSRADAIINGRLGK